LQNQRAALPAIGQAFDDRIVFLQTERFDGGLGDLPNECFQRHLLIAQGCDRFGRSEFTRVRRDRAWRVVESDFSGVFGQRAHHAHAIARMQDLHSDV
jgi:hypothetical protein